MAASTILAVDGDYSNDRLARYAEDLRAEYGVGRFTRMLSSVMPDRPVSALARRLMRNRWFVRHLLVDRWFLHRAAESP